MKTLNLKTSNKTKALGLLVAVLVPAGAAFADRAYYHGSRERGIDVSGTVVLSKEIPGGVITVGGTFGNPRPVVVEERKVVVVRQEERCEPRKVVIVREQPRKVVIVKEAPRREVVVVREEPREVVVVKERGRRGHRHGHGKWDRHDRHDHDGWDRGHDGYDRDFSQGKQVSVQQSGPNGSYHYYEDDRMVSIDDNRNGMNRHVYVQK